MSQAMKGAIEKAVGKAMTAAVKGSVERSLKEALTTTLEATLSTAVEAAVTPAVEAAMSSDKVNTRIATALDLRTQAIMDHVGASFNTALTWIRDTVVSDM